MGYLFAAAVVIGLVIGAATRRTRRLNQLCRHGFSTWLDLYRRADRIEQGGMATAFVIQSLHLATTLGAIDKHVGTELSGDLKNMDRVRLVDEWLDCGLPSVVEVIGAENLGNSEAREVGMFILVCAQGVNPTGNLKRFLARLR